MAMLDRNQRVKSRLDRRFNRIIENDLKFGVTRFKLQSIENDIRKLETEEKDIKEKRKLFSRIGNVLIVIAAAFFDIVLCQDAAPKLTERVSWFPAPQITIPIVIVVIEMCLANFVLQCIYRGNRGQVDSNSRNWYTDVEIVKKIINIFLTALFIIGLPLLGYTTYLEELTTLGNIADPVLKHHAIRELTVRYCVILGFSLISHIVVALNYRKILSSFRELRVHVTNYLMGNTIIKKRKKFNRLKRQSIELLRKNMEKAVEFVREVREIQDNNPVNPQTRQPTHPDRPHYLPPQFPRELSYAVVNYFGYDIIETPRQRPRPTIYRDPRRIFDILESNNERKETLSDDTQRKEQENQVALRGIRNDHERLRAEWEIFDRERREQEERDQRELRQHEQEQELRQGEDLNVNDPQEGNDTLQEEDTPHRPEDFDDIFGGN
jgi:hypothetical protein